MAVHPKNKLDFQPFVYSQGEVSFASVYDPTPEDGKFRHGDFILVKKQLKGVIPQALYPQVVSSFKNFRNYLEHPVLRGEPLPPSAEERAPFRYSLIPSFFPGLHPYNSYAFQLDPTPNPTQGEIDGNDFAIIQERLSSQVEESSDFVLAKAISNFSSFKKYLSQNPHRSLQGTDPTNNAINGFLTQYPFEPYEYKKGEIGFDPTLSEGEDQTLTFHDYLLVKDEWMEKARQAHDQSIQKAFESFPNLKKYLEAMEEGKIPSASWGDTRLGEEAFELEGKSYRFSRRIDMQIENPLETYDLMRLGAQLHESKTGAFVMVRDKKSEEVFLYELDKPLFLGDVSEGSLSQGVKIPAYSFEILEVYTSCGNILENAGTQEVGDVLLTDKAPHILQVEVERSDRLEASENYLMKYGAYIAELQGHITDGLWAMRLQTYLLPFLTPEQRARMIIALCKLAQTDDSLEEAIRCKIMSLVETTLLPSELNLTLKRVEELNGKEALLDLMDGPWRMKFFRLLKQKENSYPIGASVPNGHMVGDILTQERKNLGHSLYNFAKPFTQPIKTMGDIGVLLKSLAVTAEGGELSGGGMPLAPSVFWGMLGKKFLEEKIGGFQAAQAAGYEGNYIAEFTTDTVVEGGLLLWGLGEGVKLLGGYFVKFVRSPAYGLTGGYMLGAGVYNSLAASDRNSRQPFEAELFESIEEAYRRFYNGYDKSFVDWIGEVRRSTVTSLRTKDEYLHCWDDPNLDPDGLSALGHAMDFFDNDEACRYYAGMGVQIFQEKNTPKYFAQITTDLFTIYQEGVKASQTEDEIKKRILDYLNQPAMSALLAYLNSSNHRAEYWAEVGKKGDSMPYQTPFEEIGLSLIPNFDRLIPYLKTLE